MSTTELDPNLDFADPEGSPFNFDDAVPPDPRVPYVSHKKVAAWPFDEEKVDADYYSQVGDGAPGWRTTLPSGGQGCTWVPLSRALIIHSPSDAYFSQYLWDVELVGTPRLAKAALERPDGSRIFSRINVGVFAVDADCARAHKASGGAGSGVADAAWREAERLKIASVRQAIPSTFAYESRGGNRLLWTLPQPFRVRSVNDAELWKLFYVRSLAYLAREYGIIGDPATCTWNNLFRTPHATRDKGGRPEQLPTYGNPLRIGRWLYLPGPETLQADIDTVTNLAANDKTWRERGLSVLMKPKSRSRTSGRARLTSLKAFVRPLAPTDLTVFESALAAAISLVDDGRHALYLAVAGALVRRGLPHDEIAPVCERVALAAGDAKATKRRDDAANTVARYEAGAEVTGMTTLRRSWPHVAAVIDEHLPTAEDDGVEQLRATLASRPPALTIPLRDVPARIREAIEERPATPGAVTLVRVTTGAGKTDTATAVAAASTSKTALVFEMNTLARDHYAVLARSRVDVQRRFGVLSVVDDKGGPICTQKARVSAVQKAGLSTADLVCPTCPQRETCTVVGGIEGKHSGATVQVTNHALVGTAVDFVGQLGRLIIDESPQAFEHFLLTRGDLSAIADGLTLYAQRVAVGVRPLLLLLDAVFAEREAVPEKAFNECLSAARARLSQHADWRVCIGSAASEFNRAETGAEHVEKYYALALSGHCAPPLDGAAKTRIATTGEKKAAEAVGRSWTILGALFRVLCAREGCMDWDAPYIDAGTSAALRITLPNDAVAAALTRRGPTIVLDATGDEAALQHLSATPVRSINIAVADGALIERVVRYWGNGSRRRAIPGGKAAMDVVLPVIREALDRAKKSGAKSVLVVSYKVLVDELRAARDRKVGYDQELAAVLAGATVRLVLEHYGAARGKNAFEGVSWPDLDAILTLGDPWPDVAQAKAEAELLGLEVNAADSRAEQLAAAELVQVFGRLRAPRRTRPGLLLHYGRVLPADWHSGNASVEVRPEGRPPLKSSMALADLKTLIQAFGSIRGLAKASGVPETTIRHADSGQRPIGPDMADKLRPLVAARQVAIEADKEEVESWSMRPLPHAVAGLPGDGA